MQIPPQHLRALPTNATGQLHVLLINGNALGMDGTEIGVLEVLDKMRFCGLLESKHGALAKTESVSLFPEVLGDLTDKASERLSAKE